MRGLEYPSYHAKVGDKPGPVDMTVAVIGVRPASPQESAKYLVHVEYLLRAHHPDVNIYSLLSHSSFLTH
jgi:hypothetical protein